MVRFFFLKKLSHIFHSGFPDPKIQKAIDGSYVGDDQSKQTESLKPEHSSQNNLLPESWLPMAWTWRQKARIRF